MAHWLVPIKRDALNYKPEVGNVLLQSSHCDFPEKNKVFESHLHGEAEEQPPFLLQLIHCMSQPEILDRNGRREIVVLFKSR